jgi:hypothetical protein
MPQLQLAVLLIFPCPAASRCTLYPNADYTSVGEVQTFAQMHVIQFRRQGANNRHHTLKFGQ